MRLDGSRAARNILTAFAGESQARNRCTYFSSAAGKEGSMGSEKDARGRSIIVASCILGACTLGAGYLVSRADDDRRERESRIPTKRIRNEVASLVADQFKGKRSAFMKGAMFKGVEISDVRYSRENDRFYVEFRMLWEPDESSRSSIILQGDEWGFYSGTYELDDIKVSVIVKGDG